MILGNKNTNILDKMFHVLNDFKDFTIILLEQEAQLSRGTCSMFGGPQPLCL